MRTLRATNCANAPNFLGKFCADSPLTAWPTFTVLGIKYGRLVLPTVLTPHSELSNSRYYSTVLFQMQYRCPGKSLLNFVFSKPILFLGTRFKQGCYTNKAAADIPAAALHWFACSYPICKFMQNMIFVVSLHTTPSLNVICHCGCSPFAVRDYSYQNVSPFLQKKFFSHHLSFTELHALRGVFSIQ